MPCGTYNEARHYLAWDFITPNALKQQLGGVDTTHFRYTDKQLESFIKTVPPVDVLLWMQKNDYMLIPGPAINLSLRDIRRLSWDLFCKRPNTEWFHEFTQTDVVEGGRWLIVCKKGRLSRELTSVFEVVPNAAVLAYVLTVYFKVRNIRLLSDIQVRTTSKNSEDDNVFVGHFDEEGMGIHGWEAEFFGDELYTSSSRKLA